uniref:Uncharacterized protein n=1 Tax=Hemiselmis andersenii TaxID=464988 RepID=A0A7S1HMZ7_HEMAN
MDTPTSAGLLAPPQPHPAPLCWGTAGMGGGGTLAARGGTGDLLPPPALGVKAASKLPSQLFLGKVTSSSKLLFVAAPLTGCTSHPIVPPAAPGRDPGVCMGDRADGTAAEWEVRGANGPWKAREGTLSGRSGAGEG